MNGKINKMVKLLETVIFSAYFIKQIRKMILDEILYPLPRYRTGFPPAYAGFPFNLQFFPWWVVWAKMQK